MPTIIANRMVRTQKQRLPLVANNTQTRSTLPAQYTLHQSSQ